MGPMGQNGAPGPQGPQGPQGATGATGPAGNSSTQIISVESAALDEGTNYVHLQANCPPGTKVTGGGHYNLLLTGSSGNIQPTFDVYENRPFRVTGGIDMWLVGAINRGAEARDAGSMVAYAVCTKKDE
jgi:hypothetical protein